jgi:hypothetical protein
VQNASSTSATGICVHGAQQQQQLGAEAAASTHIHKKNVLKCGLGRPPCPAPTTCHIAGLVGMYYVVR